MTSSGQLSKQDFAQAVGFALDFLLLYPATNDAVVSAASITNALCERYPKLSRSSAASVTQQALEKAFEHYPDMGLSITRIDGNSSVPSKTGKYYVSSPYLVRNPDVSEQMRFIYALITTLICYGGSIKFADLRQELEDAGLCSDTPRSQCKYKTKFSKLINHAKKLGIVTVDRNQVIELSPKYINEKDVKAVCANFGFDASYLVESYNPKFRHLSHLMEE
ncbi:hypothetical protein P9112_002510 [Eukaryota sp. TZLM1-RC]